MIDDPVLLERLRVNRENLNCHLDLGYCFLEDPRILSGALIQHLESKFTWVTSLDLSSNRLFDNQILLIAPKILHSYKLKIVALLLNNNQITHVGLDKILFNLTKPWSRKHILTVLDIRSNRLGDSGAESLAAAIKNPNFKLCTLNIKDNGITLTGFKALGKAFKSNKRITSFISDLDDATQKEFLDIKKKIKSILKKNIQAIVDDYLKLMQGKKVADKSRLSHCDFDLIATKLGILYKDVIINLASKGIEGNTDYEYIPYKRFLDSRYIQNANRQRPHSIAGDLSSNGPSSTNNISSETASTLGTLHALPRINSNAKIGSHSIPSVEQIGAQLRRIDTNRNMKVLIHSGQNLGCTPSRITNLGASLKDFPLLSELDLSNNQISGFCYEMDTLTIEISKHNNLKILNLNNNNLGNNNNDEALMWIFKSKSLEKISLRCNGIGSTLISRLCAVIPQATHLQKLDLGNNKITSDGAIELANCIEFNTTLQELQVDANQIDMAGVKKLIKVFEENVNLSSLLLKNNACTGDQTETLLVNATMKKTLTIGITNRLPAGWEEREDSISGYKYYVNHNEHITQWERPRIGAQDLEDELPVSKKKYTENNKTPQYKREFQLKVDKLRRTVWAKLSGETVLYVKRDTLFEDGFDQIMKYDDDVSLKKHLRFKIFGEDGLDYGGVARETFELLSKEFSNPNYALFQYATENRTSLIVNPQSGINPDHLKYFRYIGRIIGLAVFHGHFIHSGFTVPFYKTILNKALTIEDLEAIDRDQYASMKWILENDINDLGMGLNFTVDYEEFGVIKSYELKLGGSDIDVTDENKKEFVDLIVKWKVIEQVRPQTDAFLTGFSDIIDLTDISIFDAKELEVLICGLSTIDISDWERFSIHKGYTNDSKVVLWFWKAVRDMNDEDRVRLLQFCTGTCRVPLGGFAALQGSDGQKLFLIEKVGDSSWLPRSHSCFNRLDLPPYESFEQLQQKLNIAIHETSGFGLE